MLVKMKYEDLRPGMRVVQIMRPGSMGLGKGPWVILGPRNKSGNTPVKNEITGDVSTFGGAGIYYEVEVQDVDPVMGEMCY